MKRAVLHREVLFRAKSGAIVRLVFDRFASLHDEHVLAQRVQIIGVEGSPTIRVESAIDDRRDQRGGETLAAMRARRSQAGTKSA